MARYSLGTRTSNGTDAEAAYELIAGAQGFNLLELRISLVAATATTIGLGRPAAKGVTPTTPVTLKAERDATTAALAASAVAWGTKPTIPAAFLRRAGLPATIGANVEWKFENGLVVPADATIILWNLATNSVLDVTAVIDE